MKLLAIVMSILFLAGGCTNHPDQNIVAASAKVEFEYKFSLAQWSYHKALFDGKMSTEEFIKIAAREKYQGVEFVNQFFKDEIDNPAYFKNLNRIAKDLNIDNVLIMVDIEEDLGDQNEMIRQKSINIHKKWIDAAAHAGCGALRINAYGKGSAEQVLLKCLESIKDLATYARPKNIKILIENHGGFSSDAKWLATLLQNLKEYNVSCLLDFDNWCMERSNGELWGGECILTYPRYDGMKTLIHYASGISVKSFDFDQEGEETSISYQKMSDIIKNANFNGYLGIEYEGDDPNIAKGTELTRRLMTKHLNQSTNK